MFGVIVIVAICAVTYFAWRIWSQERELKVLLDQTRSDMERVQTRAKKYCEEMDAINARMRDLHHSLNKTVCGRETTWP